MKAIKSNKIFLSVYQDGRPDWVNEVNHRTLVNGLKGRDVTFLEVNGVYEGKSEESVALFTFNLNTFNELQAFVYDMADKFNQDSVLLVDNEDQATLYKIDTKEHVPLGEFTEVSKEEAENKDHSEIAGRYFIIK